MDLWQMEYILFAEENQEANEDKRFKLFADYLGSYKDPKRAIEEMKRTQSEDSSELESTKVVWSNINYGKEQPPIVRLETEEEKVKFENEFDKAMKNTFGEGYREARIVVPAKKGDSSDSPEDEEPDEIITR